MTYVFLFFICFYFSQRCSGIQDIAVGAVFGNDSRAEDDKGRGAVYILFLNRDGTVKGEQKISDAHGGLKATLDDDDWFGVALAGIGDLDNE